MAPYYVTVDIGKDIHDTGVTPESGKKYYYYDSGWNYAYLEKKETDYGYIEYTHYPYNTGYRTYKLGSIVHKRSSQTGLPDRTALSGTSNIRVYYSSADTARNTPLLISAGLYYKSEGDNNWSQTKADNIQSELDKLSYDKRRDVVIRLEKTKPYGSVQVSSDNTINIPGYTWCTHKTSDTVTISSVCQGSTKLPGVNSVSDVTSVNAYFETLNTVPVLLEFLKTGDSYEYYSPNSKGSIWQSDGSGPIEDDNLRAKLYSVTYKLKNVLVLDVLTVGSIGDITVKNGTTSSKSYPYHEYSKSGQFTVSGLSYKTHKLNAILSDKTEVKKITTYFTKGGDKLLAIYIHFEDKNEWYITTDPRKDVYSATLFDTFLITSNEVSDTEVEKILDNVELYNKLDLVKLKASDSTLGDKLVSSLAITFDLQQKPKDPDRKDDPDTTYRSAVTKTNVTVKKLVLEKIRVCKG